MSYRNLWSRTKAVRYANSRDEILKKAVRHAMRNHLRVTSWMLDETRVMRDDEGKPLCLLLPGTKIVSVATKYSVLIAAGFLTVSCPECIAIIEGTTELRNQFHLARDP